MNTSNALIQLIADFAAREASPLTHPTRDAKQSLAYYRYEVGDHATAATGYPRRIQAWFSNLTRLEHFVADHGRLPHQNNRAAQDTISDEEKILAIWVRTERTAADNGRRCEYQLRRLGCIPGYQEHPLEDQWNTRLRSYEEALARLGRAPSARSLDRDERNLAGWAAKQRFLFHRGKLPPRRQRMLKNLTVWTWGKGPLM